MALTKAQVREILSTAGVDSEHMSDAVTKIIDGHTDSISALRDEISDLKEKVNSYKADAEKLPDVQKELETVKAEASKSGDYQQLKEEFDKYKTEVEAERTKNAKAEAYKEILKDAGITSDKAIAKVLKYTDFESIELDDDGRVKDAKEHRKAVKEEWGELVSKTSTSGADTPHPPTHNSGSGKTKEEIMKIKDTTERQKALREYLTNMEE